MAYVSMNDVFELYTFYFFCHILAHHIIYIMHLAKNYVVVIKQNKGARVECNAFITFLKKGTYSKTFSLVTMPENKLLIVVNYICSAKSLSFWIMYSWVHHFFHYLFVMFSVVHLVIHIYTLRNFLKICSGKFFHVAIWLKDFCNIILKFKGKMDWDFTSKFLWQTIHHNQRRSDSLTSGSFESLSR